jgi:hypothetical protein
MIKWDEVQRETESMLEQVRHQIAAYRQRIDALESETSKLTATIAVARQMQEGAYAKALNLDTRPSSAPTVAESDKHLWVTDLDDPVIALVKKPNWQKGIDALGEIPDLPPAIGLTRQPNKTNTSYRAGALLKLENREMDIAEIIDAFEKRGWVDSDWARPRDAITIAVKRSEKYGWTRQTNKNTYVYDPHGQDSSRQTSEDNYESEGGEDLI